MYCAAVAGMVFFLFAYPYAAEGNHRNHYYDHHPHRHSGAVVVTTPCCAAPSKPSNETRHEIRIPQQELETVVIPQQTEIPNVRDESIPRIPVPEPPTPRVAILNAAVMPRMIKPGLRRIDPSKATLIEKHVAGEVACPLNLPKGGIVRVCNARSGRYKFDGDGDTKYFHQQQCWFCENILGGDYIRWQDRMQ